MLRSLTIKNLFDIINSAILNNDGEDRYMAQDNTVRAVERALAILDCFSEDKNNFTLTELSHAIELSPSTTLRLLTTLENMNYIFRDPVNMRYYLGFRLAQLSHVAFANLDICQVVRPHLERLHSQFNESMGIYILKDDHRVCVERIECTQPLRSVVSVGQNQPLTRGASGRLLLAYLSEEEIRPLLEKDPATTFEDLARIKEYGYAVSHGERQAGVVSIAAPVFNSVGKVAAALFISGPEVRFDQYFINRLVEKVTQTARQVSMEMGYIEKDL